MNKFTVTDCRKDLMPSSELGTVVCLSNVYDPSLKIFFPIYHDLKSFVDYILSGGNVDRSISDETIISHSNLLSLYQTMIQSWEMGEQYLSGIILDAIYDENKKDNIISAKITLSDFETGDVVVYMPIGFISAIILGALYKKEIIVTMSLLSLVLPGMNGLSDEDDPDQFARPNSNKYPFDSGIMDIAQKIMENKDSRTPNLFDQFKKIKPDDGSNVPDKPSESKKNEGHKESTSPKPKKRKYTRKPKPKKDGEE